MKDLFNTKLLAASLMALSLGLTGCLTDTEDDEEETPTPIAWAFDSTLSVGAQANATLGSAVDLDKRRVMLSAAANLAQDSIDVVFAFRKVGNDSSFILAAPRTAKDSGISVAANYDTSKVKYTQFVKVSGTAPATWTAGEAAFTAGTKVTYAKIVANDVFIVKTTLNNYVLVTVSGVTGTSNLGSGTLSVKLKAM